MRKKCFSILAFCFLVAIAMSSCSSKRASSNNHSACSFTPYKKQAKPIKEGVRIAPRTPVTGVFKIK